MTVPIVPFDDHEIKLDEHGVFWYGAQRVEHPRVERMLRIGLRRLPGGGYGYIVGPKSVEVEVEDAPFQVLSVHQEDARLILSLSDESHEMLDPESLYYLGDVPYCTLKRGDKSRFSPLAALALGHFLDFEENKVILELQGQRFVIPGAFLETAPETQSSSQT
jgi:hypothetical protein